MQLKSLFALIMLLALVGFVGFATPSFARQGSDDDTASTTQSDDDEDEDEDGDEDEDEDETGNAGKLVVNPSGRVEIDNASVSSVSGSEFTVSIQGIAVKVNAASARLKNIDSVSDLSSESSVEVKGSINASTGVVSATEVKAENVKNTSNALNLEARIKELLEKLEKLRAQLGF